MNRIVLIGNGFDLAHGLKTRYQDFINWYWEQRVMSANDIPGNILKDPLCYWELEPNARFSSWQEWACSYTASGKNVEQILKEIKNCQFIYENKSVFLRLISQCKWVDIEDTYYHLLKMCVFSEEDSDEQKVDRMHVLDEQLAFLQEKLIEYLSKKIAIDNSIVSSCISEALYSPILDEEVSVEYKNQFNENSESAFWDLIKFPQKLRNYGYSKERIDRIQMASAAYVRGDLQESEERLYDQDKQLKGLPDEILFLSFNYTPTIDLYCPSSHQCFKVNHIHGTLDKPESVIFGYGDELDAKYKEILDKNENEYLHNIKSIRYLESDNYRKMLQFIDSAPFQIYIMGHSCGNSDRTLLNTLFEHKNCISIKPFYYTWTEKDKDGIEHVKDNYLELVQNISRNFTDMKLMRDRVVNKTYCKEITK